MSPMIVKFRHTSLVPVLEISNLPVDLFYVIIVHDEHHVAALVVSCGLSVSADEF